MKKAGVTLRALRVIVACTLGCAPSPEATQPSKAPATWPVRIAPVASSAPAAVDAGPADAGAVPPADAGPADAGAVPPADAGPTVAAPDDPQTAAARRFARKLLDPGWPIAYSPSTSTFAYFLTYTEEGSGVGLVFFMAHAAEEKPFETLPVCEAWECGRGEEREAHIDAALPKIAEGLRGKGYVIVHPRPWPENKSEMTLARPPLTLRWQQDHLVATRPGKASVAYPPVRHLPQHKASPWAVAVTPDRSWIAVEIGFDPGSHYGEGFNMYSEVHTYRVP